MKDEVPSPLFASEKAVRHACPSLFVVANRRSGLVRKQLFGGGKHNYMQKYEVPIFGSGNASNMPTL